MTNQEIFDDLGEMGTLMLLFLTMASVDGEITDAEASTVFDSALNFTDDDLAPHIQSANKVANSISFEERINYLKVGLSYFAEKLSTDMKKKIYVELVKIAKADGVVHDVEGALFKMAASHLGS